MERRTCESLSKWKRDEKKHELAYVDMPRGSLEEEETRALVVENSFFKGSPARSVTGAFISAAIARKFGLVNENKSTLNTRSLSSIRLGEKDIKIKRGLLGFINGSLTSALADTGAAQNVISAAFARKLGLALESKPTIVRLGNSKRVLTVGKVKVRWAFTEKPTEVYDIVCNVLQHCTYDVILGSKFLAVTETFSKHLHRLVLGVFNVPKMFHFNLLDGGRQILYGKVGGHPVFASPDTGAERNVMDLNYAEALGFNINTQPENRGFLQFADGTFQETVGQVHTNWTFASDFEIPITFEVLENCSANVVLGEDLLWEHDVFRTYAYSVHEIPYEDEDDEPFDLAPFSYQRKWEQKATDLKRKLLSMFDKRTQRQSSPEHETLEQFQTEERRRRNKWHHEYGFDGANASSAEQEDESRRRRRYNVRRDAMRRLLPPPPGESAPVIPSIATAPNDAVNQVREGSGV